MYISLPQNLLAGRCLPLLHSNTQCYVTLGYIAWSSYKMIWGNVMQPNTDYSRLLCAACVHNNKWIPCHDIHSSTGRSAHKEVYKQTRVFCYYTLSYHNVTHMATVSSSYNIIWDEIMQLDTNYCHIYETLVYNKNISCHCVDSSTIKH